jgi:hypothetical protein
MIGKFFHTPGSKQFNFRPRFYNPEKEELDDRVKKIKEEMGIVEEKVVGGKPFKATIKGQFRNPDTWGAKSSSGARKAQNKRLIWLVLILSLIFYLFFFSDFTF